MHRKKFFLLIFLIVVTGMPLLPVAQRQKQDIPYSHKYLVSFPLNPYLLVFLDHHLTSARPQHYRQRGADVRLRAAHRGEGLLLRSGRSAHRRLSHAAQRHHGPGSRTTASSFANFKYLVCRVPVLVGSRLVVG